MNYILRLIVIIIVSSGDVKSSHVREEQRSLIVGGEKVDGSKYPYIAHIGDCGAVLVGKNIFLTAAHCKTPLRVLVNKVSLTSNTDRRKLPGSTRWQESRTIFQVTDALDHPKWLKDGKNLKQYDFKLLRVSGFSDADPIVLDNPDDNNGYTNTHELLKIMGWGKTGVDEESSVDLLDVDVNVQDFQTCKQAYNDYDDTNLDETIMFCAGKSSGGKYRTTCRGDSGGPIVKRDATGTDVLVGLVSFGADECGNSNHPTVFAKVSGVYEWLVDSITNWDCSEISERRERLLYGPEVEASPFEDLFKKMSCAYIMGDITIRQAVKMYLSTPNLAILVYSDPKYWDTTKVTDMSYLFYQTGFNADISGWKTSNVVNMYGMFAFATSFNQDLSQWDVSKVTDMRGMFHNAASFNQDVSQWDVSKVTNMRRMFYGATSFSQNLCSWSSDIQYAGKVEMFYGTGCPTASIDWGTPSDTSVCHSGCSGW